MAIDLEAMLYPVERRMSGLLMWLGPMGRNIKVHISLIRA
jgi:hypothetical protein